MHVVHTFLYALGNVADITFSADFFHHITGFQTN